ncbi:beta-galactosidase [Lactobacillus sp. 3B(2020)]|uniref:beta-galactosidase n=1 Tax=Lactobacillus sp. 3B(2020) TaxID=2695882 RepID=UPI0015DDDE20|nr:beta-galactosidase [Lactobacillus sp. 3B(2020)]QLL70412.1 beta-galactosidase [Lactobacillus sp. 3B(2020)]
MFKRNLPTFLYGGDYNPDQWPADTWHHDIEVFKQAAINSATINVFSWAALNPAEGVYDFSQLDQIVTELSAAEFKIVMGTSTAAMPAWMVKKYPDIARVDYQGRRHKFGQRHNFCPTSPTFRRLASDLVDHLAAHYVGNRHIVAWHINNEYGGTCYCDQCQASFRKWLKDRYGTLEALNKAWNNTVWSHQIFDWNEIVVPNELGDAWGPEGSNTIVAGLSLDYLRFQSEMMLDEYKMEKTIIEKYDHQTPILTNFHSTPNKLIDYQAWAKDQDIVSYDSYPAYDMPTSRPAFLYDLMRSLKHLPFMLMESTPSQVNWQPYSPLKRPGQMAATELQAVAHGADTVQFFQLKQAVGGSEKFHGAVISHSGRTDTRAFKEVQKLGQTLKQIGPTVQGSMNHAKVAMLFDWSNYWALEYVAGITQDLDYMALMMDYYQQLYDRNIPVDIVGTDDDLSQYSLVIAPYLYLLKPGVAARLKQYVKAGGHFLTTMMAGMVDENDNVYLGGYPGPLKDLLGIWVEESDAFPPHQGVKVDLAGQNLNGSLLADIIHPQGAQVIGQYASEFYAGTPAITKNQFGKGLAWYVGTRLDSRSLSTVMDQVLLEAQIHGLTTKPTKVEVTQRITADGEKLTFILNLSNEVQALPVEFTKGYYDLITKQTPTVEMQPWEVAVLTSK